jgi:hypothetical protein
MARTSTRRPYRLETDWKLWTTVCYTTHAAARLGLSELTKRYNIPPGTRWRITLRAERGRKTELIGEGEVK